jgi:LemA protein
MRRSGGRGAQLSEEQIVVLAIAGVLVFWIVGAYNRLVALRSAIVAAWAGVEQTLNRRGEVVAPLVQALRVPLAAEQGTLDALLALHGQAGAAAQAMRERPLAASSASAWVLAETALAAAASRVLALLDQHAELRAGEPVAALVATWREAGARLDFMQQAYDAAATAYNEAAAQAPTRWLLPFFRFAPAGRLRS